MFLNNAIHQYIKDQGLHPLSKPGSDLVKSGMVSKPLHHPKSKVILIMVKDQYHLIVQYKNAFRLETVSCSCGRPLPCEHVFAALFFLLETDDSALQEMETLPAGFDLSGGEDHVSSMHAMPLNEYRDLPIKDSNGYAEFLNLYKPPFLRHFTALTLDKIVLKKHDNVEGHISEKHYFQDGQPEKIHKVDLRFDEGKFQVRCHHCHEESFALCLHQYELIKHHDIKTMILFGRIPDFDSEAESWARKTGISVDKFKVLYELIIEGQKTKAVLVNQRFFPNRKLIQLREKIEAEVLITREEVTNRSNEETDGSFGNALLWWSGQSEQTVVLIKGKQDKTGSDLLSKIERTENPAYLPAIEKEIWYKIDRFCKEISLDQGIKKDHSWNYFLQQLGNEVNLIPHYISSISQDSVMISRRQLSRITFSPYLLDLRIQVTRDESFYAARLFFQIHDKVVDPKDVDIQLMPYFLVINHEAYIFKHPEYGRLFSLIGWDEMLVDIEHADAFRDLMYTLHNMSVIDYPAELKPDFFILENPRWKIKIHESGNRLVFTPLLSYIDILEVSIPVDKWIFKKSDSSRLYTILEEDVDRFSSFLFSSHPHFESSLYNHGMYFLHIKDYLHENWFLHFYEKCRDMGIAFSGHDMLENFRMNTYKPSVKLGLTSGIDWFDVHVDLRYGDQKVAAKTWMEAMKNNEKYIVLPDGSLGMLPEDWFEKLKKLSMVAYEENGRVKMNLYHFNIVESLFEEIEDDVLQKDIKNKIALLGEYDFKKIHALPDVGKASLRDYQKLGFQWLKSLSELGFGGCLADDMGLGKTLQVLTLLADQKNAGKYTSLIVVPRSLLFNWAAEIKKFFPDLTFMFYHGNDRAQNRFKIFLHDLLISTYDTVTNDIEYLRSQLFNYIILDESQAIKNPDSKRYKAMRLLKSNNKIVLTGTPIENNTFDLYAQFSFVNPGIFGSATQFKNNFAIPIDKENDQEAAYMLRKIIHPFLLRRTKAQVAKDLPERSENILYCEMGETQRAMYEEFKHKIKSEVEEGVKMIGLPKMRIKVIEGLLRLRQICNSPRLLDSNLPNHMRQSVKIETLLEIIENDLGDHHALVYSQFTSMLALVREELDKKGIPYAYLDGSTRDRQAAVSQFMDNQEVRLFLISLKAGNTGLNLVKADYVYILDPWWNPAVEAQAIDRTHRIGQDKSVFAYKMICRDTVEEKIVLLQERKKQLATDLIITDEQVFKSLDNEDLIALFN